MGLKKTIKQGYERYFIHGDFSDVMETGETIDTSTVTALDSGGEDATADVIDDASKYVDGFLLYIRVKDGTEAGGPYKFTIRIETSLGNRWEVDGQINIKEL